MYQKVGFGPIETTCALWTIFDNKMTFRFVKFLGITDVYPEGLVQDGTHGIVLSKEPFIFGMHIQSPNVLYLDVGPGCEGRWLLELLDVGAVHQAATRTFATGSPRDTVFLSRRTTRNYLCNIRCSQGILYRLLGRLLSHPDGGLLYS